MPTAWLWQEIAVSLQPKMQLHTSTNTNTTPNITPKSSPYG